MQVVQHSDYLIITANLERVDTWQTARIFDTGSGMSQSSGVFTFPSGDRW